MKPFIQRPLGKAMGALLLCALLLGTSLPLAHMEAAEVASAGVTIDPTVRVHLRRLGISDRMDVTLSSAYLCTLSSGAQMRFAKDSQLSFQLKNGDIYLYYDSMSISAGQEASLTRFSDEQALEIGFRLTNYPALYIGDLRLSAVENTLRPVLSIHVEDYLLGVVPYEMSNSFPLEALKAQAVAARTYVLGKQGAAGDYDVVDTTNDQVFRGYQPGNDQAEKAVGDTYGVCGFYKGKLATCYYAASNGGRTELAQSVWPTDKDMGYFAQTDDPYDLENPQSVVKRTVVQKKYGAEEIAPFGLRNLLAIVLKEQLTALHYDAAPESVRVREIQSLSLEESAKPVLRLTALLSGRTRTDGPTVAVAAIDPDTEETSLFETAAPPTGTPQPETSPTLAPTPSPTPAPVYGAFEEIAEAFTLEIPVFPTAEQALGMNISPNYENEIWSLKEDGKAYTLEARRFGHGVGMSQRGAQWMAFQYKKTYREILAFYYPGMELLRFEESQTPLPAAREELAATAGPPPTPTPRPTLMPLSASPSDGQWVALVTGIEDDSSLNLRSLPDLSGEVVMRLFKNQRLLVLERCQEPGWVKVATDATQGYVMESFLTAEE